MRRRWVRWVVMVVGVGCVCGGEMGVAAQDVGGDTVYKLHGSVVDGVTGKPVARALVESNDRRIATMTDGEGRFAVDVSVPAAETPTNRQAARGSSLITLVGSGFRPSIYMTAAKPGYITPQGLNGIALDETLSARDVVLKLMPEASISGRVSASGVDAAAGVNVMLLMRTVDDDGRLRWVQSGNHVTNRRGEFRLGNLQPGEYALRTMEWRGDQPFQRPGAKAVTQVYPAVYFGDVAGLTASVKLHLGYGENKRAEIHLHMQTEYPVTVPVVGMDAGAGVNCQVMNVDGDGIFGPQLRYDAKASAFVGNLPNGSYTLKLMSFGQQPQFGTGVLHVEGAAVQAPTVTMAPPGVVEVRVHPQFTATEASEASEKSFNGPVNGRVANASGAQAKAEVYPLAQVQLRPDGNMNAYGSGEMVMTDRNDAFSLKNVAPGRYSVTVRATRGYVASATSAGEDVLERGLAIGTGATLDVVLRDDGATVMGKVTGMNADGDGMAHAIYLLLLPTDASARFTQGYVMPDGTFTVGNVAPGSYRMVAMRMRPRPWIAYRDAETMRRFDGKGVALIASYGGKVQVDVPLLSDADLEAN